MQEGGRPKDPKVRNLTPRVSQVMRGVAEYVDVRPCFESGREAEGSGSWTDTDAAVASQEDPHVEARSREKTGHRWLCKTRQ